MAIEDHGDTVFRVSSNCELSDCNLQRAHPNIPAVLHTRARARFVSKLKGVGASGRLRARRGTASFAGAVLLGNYSQALRQSRWSGISKRTRFALASDADPLNRASSQGKTDCTRQKLTAGRKMGTKCLSNPIQRCLSCALPLLPHSLRSH